MPQRARRSAVEWTPPKLVASATSAQASRNAWARSALSSAKPTSGPAKAIWRAAISVPDGWTTSATSSRARSSSASAVALALERSRRRPSVASERCASHASKPPAIAPDERAPAPQRLAPAPGRRTETAAEQHVGVPAERSWCPRASRSRPRGRAAAGRAGCRPCCRPRAARPRRARPRPRRRCRRGPGAGWTASRPTRARRRRSRRRSPVRRHEPRSRRPSGSSCSRRGPRMPG